MVNACVRSVQMTAWSAGTRKSSVPVPALISQTRKRRWRVMVHVIAHARVKMVAWTNTMMLAYVHVNVSVKTVRNPH